MHVDDARAISKIRSTEVGGVTERNNSYMESTLWYNVTLTMYINSNKMSRISRLSSLNI